MKKKREKKKFIRKNLKFRNIEVKNLDNYEDEEIIEEKRAEKKTIEKGENTLKSGLNLIKGKVINIKSNYRYLVEIDNEIIECTLSGRLKQINFETSNVMAVGDFVNVDFSANQRIEEILPRKNSLSRFAEDSFQTEIIVASNIDQVIITASVKEPELKLGLIDRYICAANIAEIEPLICINKIDLTDDISLLKKKMLFYEDCGYKVIFTSVLKNMGINDLKSVLENRDSVFSGHSGAGKSSLINILLPGINLRVSKISSSARKGSHTTTSSRLIKWNFGGYFIDTPGIKTFSLHTKQKDFLPRVFPGFQQYRYKCKYPDCTHTHEQECAVKKALQKNEFPKDRYESYIRIYDSLNN